MSAPRPRPRPRRRTIGERSGSSGLPDRGDAGQSDRQHRARHLALDPIRRHSDRHRCGPAALPPRRRPRDRSQCPCRRVGHRVPLRGHGDRCYRRRRSCHELPRSAGPGDPHRDTTCMGMAVSCDHRHGDQRQHPDAGCARRQTRSPHTSCRYTMTPPRRKAKWTGAWRRRIDGP
jgi:hypothetical protein